MVYENVIEPGTVLWTGSFGISGGTAVLKSVNDDWSNIKTGVVITYTIAGTHEISFKKEALLTSQSIIFNNKVSEHLIRENKTIKFTIGQNSYVTVTQIKAY